MGKCIFCKIVEGKEPSMKIYEDENVLAFAPLKETIIAKGHMLVIPKKHYINIYDIPKDELHAVMGAIKLISETLKDKMNAKGINILHASGKVAQQSCFHFHIHLIPRYENDGLDTWPTTDYEEQSYTNVYKKLASVF